MKPEVRKYPGNHFTAAKISQMNVNPMQYHLPRMFVCQQRKSRSPSCHFLVQCTSAASSSILETIISQMNVNPMYVYLPRMFVCQQRKSRSPSCNFLVQCTSAASSSILETILQLQKSLKMRMGILSTYPGCLFCQLGKPRSPSDNFLV